MVEDKHGAKVKAIMEVKCGVGMNVKVGTKKKKILMEGVKIGAKPDIDPNITSNTNLDIEPSTKLGPKVGTKFGALAKFLLSLDLALGD